MYVMYVLGLMFMIAMYIVTGSDQDVAAENKIQSRVTQMVAYHDYAVKFCDIPGNCGSIAEVTSANVASTMPSVMTGSVSYTDGRFKSFTNGSGLVVTISADHNFDISTVNQNNLGNSKMVTESSEIAVALTSIAGANRPAGRYDRSALTLTSYDGTSISVPSSLAGTSFQNSVPMIAEN
jgi:hypothetical protein